MGYGRNRGHESEIPLGDDSDIDDRLRLVDDMYDDRDDVHVRLPRPSEDGDPDGELEGRSGYDL